MRDVNPVVFNRTVALEPPTRYLARERFRVFKRVSSKALREVVDLTIKVGNIALSVGLIGKHLNSSGVAYEDRSSRSVDLSDRIKPLKDGKKYYAIPSKKRKFLANFFSSLKNVRYNFVNENKKEVFRSAAGLVSTIGTAAEVGVSSLKLIKLISEAEGLKNIWGFMESMVPGFNDFLKNIPLECTPVCLWAGVVAKSIGIPLAVISVVEKNKMLSELERRLGLKGFKTFSPEAFGGLENNVESGLEYINTLKRVRLIEDVKKSVVLNEELDSKKAAVLSKDSPGLGVYFDSLQFENVILKRIRKEQVIKKFNKANLSVLADATSSPEILGFRSFKVKDKSSYYIWDKSKMNLSRLSSKGFAKILKSSRWRSSLRVLRPKDLMKNIPLDNIRTRIFEDVSVGIFNIKKVKDLEYKTSRLINLRDDPSFFDVLEHGDVELAKQAGVTITDANRSLYKELFKLVSMREIDSLKKVFSWKDLKADPDGFRLKFKEAIETAALKEVVEVDSPSSIFSEQFLMDLTKDEKVLDCLRGLLPDDKIKALIDPKKLFKLFNSGSVLDRKTLKSLKQEVSALRASAKTTLKKALTAIQVGIKGKKGIKISLHTIGKVPKLYFDQAGRILESIKNGPDKLKKAEEFRGKVLLESLRYRMGRDRNMSAVALSTSICALGILFAKAAFGMSTVLAGGPITVCFAVALLVVTVIPLAQRAHNNFILKKADRDVVSHDSIYNIRDRLKLYKEELGLSQDPRHRKAINHRIKKLNRELKSRLAFKSYKMRTEFLAI